jgi:hypothetical protein
MLIDTDILRKFHESIIEERTPYFDEPGALYRHVRAQYQLNYKVKYFVQYLPPKYSDFFFNNCTDESLDDLVRYGVSDIFYRMRFKEDIITDDIRKFKEACIRWADGKRKTLPEIPS